MQRLQYVSLLLAEQEQAVKDGDRAYVAALRVELERVSGHGNHGPAPSKMITDKLTAKGKA